MKVRIEGDFLAAEPWEFHGKEGFSVSILQDASTAKLSVSKDDAPAQWPSRMTPVVIEGTVRPGYEGRGFKTQVQ